MTGRLHSGALVRGADAARSRARSPACEGSHLVEVAGKTLAPPRDDAGRHRRAARRVRDARPRELHLRGRRHPPRRARRAVRALRATWSPKLRVVEEALDERVWANGPLAAVAIGDAAQVAAAHDELRAHARRHLLGQLRGQRVSRQARGARARRRARTKAPRCARCASGSAAPSTRPLSSATGSTTCRCSRSRARAS